MNINPYAQGGWFNPENENSISNVPWSPDAPPQPSMYGALPFADVASEAIHKFGFKFEHTILQSLVFGPTKRPIFRVANDMPRVGYTTFTNSENVDFAEIEWGSERAMVALPGLGVDKQPVGTWMPLSPDRSKRAMFVCGKWFSWIPGNNEICMYLSTHGSKAPTLYAKIYRDQKLRAVVLEVSTQAIQLGLLETLVVATVLLQSGLNIE